MATISATGSKNHHTFTLTVNENSYSTEGNYSLISFSLDAGSSSYDFNWSSKSIQYTVTINGVGYTASNGKYPRDQAWTVMSRSDIVIPHDNNGGKTIGVSFSVVDGINQSYTTGNASASGTMVLTNIPREVTITSASDFTDSDNPYFYFSNPGGFTINYANLIANPISHNPLILTRNNIANSGSYTWILTSEEREAFRNACPGPSCTVRFVIYTNINTAYADRTFTMGESAATRPDISLSISADNSNIPQAVRDSFNGIYVQRKTKISAVITASAKYRATISNYATSIDGNSYTTANFTSAELNQFGTYNITSTTTDSRGFPNSDSKTVSVLEYNRPTIIPPAGQQKVDCFRSDNSGNPNHNSTTVWLNVKKSFSSLNNLNSCSLMYRRKLENEAWNNQPWVSLQTVDDEFSGALLEAYSLTSAYNIQIKVEDILGESEVIEFSIPTDDVPLHLGYGGTTVGIGRYANASIPYSVSFGWDAYFGGDIYIKDGNRYITLLDMIYPVGSIYLSVNSANPSTLFGGTWEQIKDTFLLASGDTYAGGSMGGEAEHILTTDEMPVHSHTASASTSVSYDASVWSQKSGYGHVTAGSVSTANAADITGITASTSVTIGNTGSNWGHNNMPPYLAVYVWKRTG